MESAVEIIRVLGGKDAMGPGVRDEETLARRIRLGLPYDSLEHIASLLKVDLQELGDVLLLSKSTRVRRKNKLFRAVESDRLVRLAGAVAEAERVLGSLEKAATWLQRPNRALGGEKPLHKLDTEVGEKQVEQLLGRIEHGVIG